MKKKLEELNKWLNDETRLVTDMDMKMFRVALFLLILVLAVSVSAIALAALMGRVTVCV